MCVWGGGGGRDRYTFTEGGNSVKMFLPPFLKVVYPKRKEFAPFGANSFLLE